MPRRPLPAPQQPDLFADEPAAASAEAPEPPPAPAANAARRLVQLQVQPTDQPLSKPQREFNRLTALIAQRRQALGEWQAMQTECQQRAARLLVPEMQKLGEVQRSTVLWIDAYLSAPPKGERLTKKNRQKLVFMLLTIARGLLEDRPDAEVEAAHDRHADQRHAELAQEQVDLAAGVLGEITGDHGLFEGPADSVEALLQRASARMRQQADAAPDGAQGSPHPAPGDHDSDEPGWARQARSARARQAEARAAQARQEASQSVREVYRRLASHLHPDREPDPAERARKTALMARVNEAHDRRDLLTLLNLQLEVAQIDAAHLAALSDQRLKQFCLVLREQLATLDDELADIAGPLAAQLGQRPDRLKPRQLADMLDRQIRLTREAISFCTRDLVLLRDASTRQDFLRQLQIDDPDEGLDPFEEMLLMQAFDEAVAAQARPQPRGRRKRR